MPHATPPHAYQDEQDELLIQQVLNPDPNPENNIDFTLELEPGEKADDAIDFGDLSDGDLAEDEDETTEDKTLDGHVDDGGDIFAQLNGYSQEEDLPGLTNGSGPDGDDIDDLFGDVPSSPLGFGDTQIESRPFQEETEGAMSFDFQNDVPQEETPGILMKAPVIPTQQPANTSSKATFQDILSTAPEDPLSKEERLQKALFAMSEPGGKDHSHAPPEIQKERLADSWPEFDRDAIPRFATLLRPKRVRYVGKSPLKAPRPIQISKASLELGPDQEKSFRVSYGTAKRTFEEADRPGFVTIPHGTSTEDGSDDDVNMESDFENEPVGGVTWQDLQIVCEDWDTYSLASSLGHDEATLHDGDAADDFFRDFNEKLEDTSGRPSAKRRKLGHEHTNILAEPQFTFPSLQDPEYITSKIARTVTLDLNDPQLLVEVDRAHTKAPETTRKGSTSRAAFSKTLSQRYNISNDEAYDLLKENHQSKVRSTLASLTVDHSMPAVRLQWPYYKTKLGKQEARSFHRPLMVFKPGEPVLFSKPRHIKTKHRKGKETQQILETAKDLSLGDNSNVLLLEYSEEHPIMLSNFGMGSKVVNYYRRKDMEDTSRPKLDLGETQVLLPQDKSPFSVFGHIDPGDITPAFQNSMYKAPMFKQEPKSTDFLVIRNSTGVEGHAWYIRNIENIHVVGQQFPTVDVPGPHSRKVTTASKNRLKMVSFRRIRRNKPHRINIGEITPHFLDTTDMQNRQKMKEFMHFSKEHREWEMRPGESIPDEATIRAMVKPEDVCLLEAMQVGQQHLQDAGFSRGDDPTGDDEVKDGQSIEEQLAPWATTRNFLNAAQGKAMLQLHGEGDPSGRGEAFSFIKTSMKGGFRALGESVEATLDAKKLKDGDHKYNVAKQQRSYEESIRRIWNAQKQSLSSIVEQSDEEVDIDSQEEPEEYINHAATPRSGMQTPIMSRRRDDETTSQFSKFSTDSRSGKVLKITRNVKDQYGKINVEQEIIRDPRVIRQYLKRRYAKEIENLKLSDLKPTGDAEKDARAYAELEKELARLERNQDRRIARDKQKGIIRNSLNGPDSPATPGSPNVGGSQTKTTGTQRKCANCGQVGHIKTNKKCPPPFFILCPMLNGTMKQEDGFADSAFTMGGPPL